MLAASTIDPRKPRLTGVNRIDRRTCNKERFCRDRPIYPIHAQAHVKQYGEGVFAAINQMRERISGIVVTPQTL